MNFGRWGGLVLRARAESTRRTPDVRAGALAVSAILTLLVACHGEQEPVAPEIRPVRTVMIERQAGGETVTLTGTVYALEEVNLAFRTGGRMIERNVNVGDRVRPGQLIARVEAVTQQNAVQSARANLSGAMGQLTEARNNFDRQQRMLAEGVVSRAVFDRAVQTRQTAQAQVDVAQAQLSTARDQLTYTELFADSEGVVTARGAEPGEVVSAGRMIVTVARQGGRDAVFNVPARVIEKAPVDPEVSVALTTNPSVQAKGRVREVSPQADPVTRTFEVRVGLIDPPEAMRLGSTVSGTLHLGEVEGIHIPASALTSTAGRPAVWIVDTESSTVSLRNVDVLRFGVSEVVVSQGLEPDDVVVTAGVQALSPGQKVRLLQTTP
jgi:RND family efflux transporter MFP subunit